MAMATELHPVHKLTKPLNEQVIEHAGLDDFVDYSWMIRVQAISAQHLGRALQNACMQKKYQNVEILIESDRCFEIFPFDLAASFEILAQDPSSLQTIQKVANLPKFSFIHYTQIRQTFCTAVSSNHTKAIHYFISHLELRKHLSSEECVFALQRCIERKDLPLFQSLLHSPDFLSILEPNKELFFFAVDHAGYEFACELSTNPSFRAILDLCLFELFVHVLKTRSLGSLLKFIEIRWIDDLNETQLVDGAVAIAGRDRFVQFKHLITNYRYESIYQKGLISDQINEVQANELFQCGIDLKGEFPAERVMGIAAIHLLQCDRFEACSEDLLKVGPDDWDCGFAKALTKGKSEHAVRILLTLPVIGQSLTEKQKKKLFMLACETSASYPANWALAHALAKCEPIDWVAWRSIIESCVIFAAQHNLHDLFKRVLSRDPFGSVGAQVVKHGFILAGRRGHEEMVRELLDSQRSSEITSDEITEVFRGSERMDNRCFAVLLAPLYAIRIEPDQANQIFAILVREPHEMSLEYFWRSSCFRDLDPKSLRLLFEPLIDMGTMRREGDDHESAIQDFHSKWLHIFQMRSTIDQIIKKPMLGKLYQVRPIPHLFDELDAIFLAAAGMGHYSLVTKIYALKKDSDPVSSQNLFLAALQTCSGQSFLTFYQENNSTSQFVFRPIPWPILICEDEKLAILKFLLNDWHFRDFNSLGFEQRIYPRLRELLFLAAHSGSVGAASIVLQHCTDGGIGFRTKDLLDAQEIATKEGKAEMVKFLSTQFPTSLDRCIIA